MRLSMSLGCHKLSRQDLSSHHDVNHRSFLRGPAFEKWGPAIAGLAVLGIESRYPQASRDEVQESWVQGTTPSRVPADRETVKRAGRKPWAHGLAEEVVSAHFAHPPSDNRTSAR